MADIDQLKEMRRKAHESGDTQAARRYTQRILAAQNGSSVGSPVDLAKGIKTGFDKAAYALADLTPDVPIPKDKRNSWNGNLLVKSLGITVPDRQERAEIVGQGQRQADRTTLGKVGNVVGEMAPAMALAYGTGGASTGPMVANTGRNVLANALRNTTTSTAAPQGVLGYATAPGDALDRTTSGLAAATGDAVGGAIPNAAARMFKPLGHRPPVQRLLDKGVVPTYGQALGGNAKKMEEIMTSFPGIGGGISNAQKDVLEAANKAALQEGGISVPAAGFAGQKAVSDYFEDAFPDALRNLSFDIKDPAFLSGVEKITRSSNLDKRGVAQLNKFINDYANNLGMTLPNASERGLEVAGQAPLRQLLGGDDLHSLLRLLKDEGSKFRKSQDPYHQNLGQAYGKVLSLAEDLMTKNPANKAEDIAKFNAVRNQYARTKPAMAAGEAATVNRSDGIFTPEQYQRAMVSNLTKLGNKKAIREGTGPQQQLASDMMNVIGAKYPDSGTALRAMVAGGGLGTIGLMTEDPAAVGLGGLGLLGMSALTRGAYSPAMRRAVMGDYSIQKMAADALRRTAPVTSGIGAGLGPQIVEE